MEESLSSLPCHIPLEAGQGRGKGCLHSNLYLPPAEGGEGEACLQLLMVSQEATTTS